MGLGILLPILAPFAVPGLLLCLPLVVPLIPLALVSGLVWLLARAVILPVRLVRGVMRRRAGGFEQGRPPDVALHTR